VLLAAHE